MPVFIHDGRRPGHMGWISAALSSGVADGAIISPFHTPRVASPRNPSGLSVAQAVRSAGGELIFDATTHGALLPNANDLIHYDTWNLWGQTGRGLDTDVRRLDHLERVFARQDQLGSISLAPTLTLDSPDGVRADHAMLTAQAASGLRATCAQSLAGRRSFWRAGAALDAYIGRLASLRAPTWVITVVHDTVADSMPDLADIDAFVGLARTVHSLSLRSRVILAQSDYAGLPFVAAGANTIGAGWDRGMRFFDPASFQAATDSAIRIAASYVTHGNLAMVLRRTVADVIDSVGSTIGEALRDGPMPPTTQAQRHHHLSCLRGTVECINRCADRASRVQELLHLYTGAQVGLRYIDGIVPRLVAAGDKRRWIQQPVNVLQRYALEEGLQTT